MWVTTFFSKTSTAAYTIPKNLNVFWGGFKYAVRDNIDLTGAYYEYYQPDYSGTGCTSAAVSSKCRGYLNAVSGVIDWRPFKRLDIYAGVMYSQVSGGLANGYLHTNTIDPSAGHSVPLLISGLTIYRTLAFQARVFCVSADLRLLADTLRLSGCSPGTAILKALLDRVYPRRRSYPHTRIKGARDHTVGGTLGTPFLLIDLRAFQGRGGSFARHASRRHV